MEILNKQKKTMFHIVNYYMELFLIKELYNGPRYGIRHKTCKIVPKQIIFYKNY